jgi:putative transposase
MMDREHKLPLKRQAEALSISRGTAYYKPRPVSERDLLLMRKLDELHLNYPFAGRAFLLLLCPGEDSLDVDFL